MNKFDAEKVVTGYLRPIYGFAVNKCGSFSDAEDLAQEIILKVYRALLLRDDIENCDKFVWTIAHNSLVNYYRKRKPCYMNLPIEAAAYDERDLDADIIDRESVRRLQTEIARLSDIQRRIVIAFYYENKSVKRIASEFDISTATVKWHLYESRKTLKESFENMRTGDLTFNPVEFDLTGFSGSVGEMGGTGKFFRSALAQNIAYSVYRKGKTVNEIADDLGVSPVYVAGEAEFLEKYGYLIKKGNYYCANILINSETREILDLQQKMYSKAAEIYANALYKNLCESKLLSHKDIECYYKSDSNYLLWALIPYIAANDRTAEEKIKFEECATRRLDGSFDIAYALIKSSEKPEFYDSMKKWCGPAHIADSGHLLWCCNSEWSDGRNIQKYASGNNLRRLVRMRNGETLSADEYAYLAEQGFIGTDGGEAVMRVVCLNGKEINNKLLALGQAIRREYEREFSRLKKPYEEATLESTPKHLRKTAAYGLQYTFYADGWFLIYVIKELLSKGKLRLPTDGQRKSLMTVVV